MLNRSATTTTSNVTSHVHVRHPCEAVAQVLASSSQKRFVSCSNNMKVMRRVGPTTVAAATLTSKRRETAVDSAPRTRRTTSTRDWGGSAVAVCAAAAAVTTALSMPSANEEENSRSSTFAGMVTAMASTGMRSLAEPRKKGTKKENEKKQSKATTEEKEKDEHEEEILFEVGKFDFFLFSILLYMSRLMDRSHLIFIPLFCIYVNVRINVYCANCTNQ